MIGSSATIRYFFVIQWQDRQHDDRHGTLLPSGAAAVEYAHRIIRELKEAGGFDDPDLKMIIKNEVGDIIHVIPF